ncbi:MAG: type V CRISPR-associated protein Cas12a/Cpf1 [Fluviicola sp.]|nr:type V CRISPR-associated protein Cas12a/Cpf1 [Fluviicola sp.]
MNTTCTNLFALSKTLRFELIPQGKTLDFIQEKGLITNDEQRADSYQKMKKTIDEFHKYFIDLALKNVRLSFLEDYLDLYKQSAEYKKEPIFKEKLKKVQDNLRKEIVQSFSKDEVKTIFSILDKKELITVELEKWFENKEKKDLHFDEKFKTFTTYFTGFHQNRKNMYSSEPNSTAIAFRLIHENLPKFLENAKAFERIKQVPELQLKIEKIYKDFELYLNVNSIEELFELNYFNDVLTQMGIDVYNNIIGGRTETDGKPKIQGLNEIINLYNQTKSKNERLPKLKQLYKQILSDSVSLSFLPDAFTDGNQVLKAIFDFYKINLLSFTIDGQTESKNLLELIQQLLANISSFETEKIYLKNDTNLTTISQQLFGDFSVFSSALNYWYETKVNPKFTIEYSKVNEKKRENMDKTKAVFTKQDYFSIAFLQEIISEYSLSLDKDDELITKITPTCVADYFKNHFVAKKENETDKTFGFIANITAKYQCIQGILENADNYEEELKQDQKLIDDIKLFLDTLLELLHFIKPLHLKSDSITEKDNAFYDVFENYYEALNLLTPLYNMVRNYVTQKPYSTKKIKLNFDNSSFLSGWSQDYSSKGGLIIKKDTNYYLLIVDKKLTDEEKNKLKKNPELNLAYRVVMDFQKPDNKNTPRLFIRSKGTNFSPAVAKYNLPINDIIDIYDNGKFKTEYRKKNYEDYKVSLVKMIDYFKEGFRKHESYKHYNFSWKPSNEYDDIAQFYNDVQSSCYQLHDEKINFDALLEMVSEGKLYLFQIYNKDFSPYSKGKPNMHTLYWNALFEEQNLKNVVYTLNGQAEIFFRKASIKHENIITHKANQSIKAKNPLTPDAKNSFEYDLIKDKRFTVDKFQFHVPITLNFKAIGGSIINQNVLEYLKKNPEVKIIGLDRGERHLVYLTLIDQEGNILKQESLNTITDAKISTPYHQLLDNKEKVLDLARKNWGTVENIKELKEGYISQVVHKIATMMVEENAIVVMEDLNFGFKRGRFKVEKQIYQKLEKMLIDKLNYLVLKDKQPTELGGLYNALQLTNKFESFQKMGKQSGFLFYVPAWNTSKIDPTTGFVNYFYTKYENVDKAKAFFDKFQSIRYNTKANYFEFEVKKYSDFNPKAEGTLQEWTVCSYGERIETKRLKDQNNNFVSTPINLTEKIEDFLGRNNIVYNDGTCIKSQIAEKDAKEFFERLLYWFKMTLQMRNSVTGSDEDYLISPVMNAKGEFYDSRKADDTLPKDADANGAYHIAKKGLMLLNKIEQADLSKKVDLSISNREWINFVQK